MQGKVKHLAKSQAPSASQPALRRTLPDGPWIFERSPNPTMGGFGERSQGDPSPTSGRAIRPFYDGPPRPKFVKILPKILKNPKNRYNRGREWVPTP